MYKFGQGMASRIGALVTLMVIGFYAAYKWYGYSRFMESTFGGATLTIGIVGSLVLVLGFAYFGLKIALYKERSGDFLIDMDGELRKVVWPSMQPLFDPKTEAWGHTYVVIVCTIVFTVIIWLVDLFLYYSIDRLLFNTILFPST